MKCDVCSWRDVIAKKAIALLKSKFNGELSEAVFNGAQRVSAHFERRENEGSGIYGIVSFIGLSDNAHKSRRSRLEVQISGDEDAKDSSERPRRVSSDCRIDGSNGRGIRTPPGQSLPCASGRSRHWCLPPSL